MGELIKVLGDIKLSQFNAVVEINEGNNGNIIHIQSNFGRIEMNEENFIRLLGGILVAEERLNTYKK